MWHDVKSCPYEHLVFIQCDHEKYWCHLYPKIGSVQQSSVHTYQNRNIEEQPSQDPQCIWFNLLSPRFEPLHSKQELHWLLLVTV